MTAAQHELAVRPGSQGANNSLEGVKHSQLVRGGDSTAVYSAGASSPRVLCVVLGFTTEKAC